MRGINSIANAATPASAIVFSAASCSTATSTPSALNFFTVSGEAATRGSDGSISLATAIFMRPPAGRARKILEHDPEKWLPVFQAQTTSRSAVTVHPELIALQRNSSDVLLIGAGRP